jgi:hypothetical protein
MERRRYRIGALSSRISRQLSMTTFWSGASFGDSDGDSKGAEGIAILGRSVTY